MAIYRFDGFCHDCFNRRSPLRRPDDPRLVLQVVPDMNLCEACYKARENELAKRKEPRAVGIPEDVQGLHWEDLPLITMTPDRSILGRYAELLTISSKIRLPDEGVVIENYDADVRILVGENKNWWPSGSVSLWVPNINRNPKWYALSGIIHELGDLFKHYDIPMPSPD